MLLRVVCTILLIPLLRANEVKFVVLPVVSFLFSFHLIASLCHSGINYTFVDIGTLVSVFIHSWHVENGN